MFWVVKVIAEISVALAIILIIAVVFGCYFLFLWVCDKLKRSKK